MARGKTACLRADASRFILTENGQTGERMRWIIRSLGLLATLLVLAIGALFLMPADRIAGLVESRFEAATGRALTIEGDVRPGLWPEIGVKTGPITIADADWAGTAPMVAAEGLSVGIAWTGLFGGDIRVTGVELTRPVIRLARAADGRGNWELAAASAPAAPDGRSESGGPSIALDNLTISDGTVSFTDAGARPITLTGIDATLTLPDFAGEAALTLNAEANGVPLTAELSIAQFARFLSDGAVPVALTAGIGEGTLEFDGHAGLAALAAEGRILADLDGIGPLTRAAGGMASALPEGLGAERVFLDSAMTFAGDTLSLRETSLQLDQNQMSGEIDLTLAEPRPKLVAQLSAGALDLSGLSGGGEEEEIASASDSPEGWSTEPIDVSGLGALDADVALDAQSIALSQSQLGRTRLRLALENGRLVTTIRELKAYDGAVTGQVVVNSRGGLSASADLAGSAIAISRLFAELLDFDRLITLGDMEISVLASGNSMDALMNGMNGEGSFRFGAGELLGLDLPGMIRNLDPGFIGEGKATIFDEVTGTFRIVNGVVINDNLKMTAPLFTANGSGEVSLGGRRLNYRIVPKLLSGEGEGISVPVLITGTWAAPKFRLDLESMVDAKAQAEIEKARDKAEAKAKEKLLEKLGGGADAEDAAKDKLEKELSKGLKKLFK